MERDTAGASAEDAATQDMEAAFAGVFDGAEAKTEAKPPEPAPAEPKAEAAPKPETPAPQESEAAPTAPSPTLTAEEIVALRAAASTIPELQRQLREANGRVGALDSLIHDMRKQAKATPPAPPAPPTLKRMQEQYPELAQALAEDMAEVNQGRAVDPEEVNKVIEAKLAEGLAKHQAEIGRDVIRSLHPDFDDMVKSADFWTWEATQPEATRKAIRESGSPAEINPILTRFKADRDAKAKAEATAAQAAAEKQARLTGAITPEGARRPPGNPTLSDAEALAKGFAEGFQE